MVRLLLVLAACQTPETGPVSPGSGQSDVDTDDTAQVDDTDDTAQVDDTGPEAEGVYVALDELRLLRRLSLDLRGTLPTLDEYAAVSADPDSIDETARAWLDTDAFYERLVQLWGERLGTQVDEFDAHHYDYLLDDTQEYAFERAVGQEPLRLMAHVATNDLPWTDVVTAEYTVANELLVDIWGLEGYPEGGSGWHPVTYPDERPLIGVLATNGLWWRYPTTTFNQNRLRVATLSRLMLCEDLLSRPVSFDDSDSLLEAEDTSAMVRSVPSCLSCHATIEPLAASLYGFWWAEAANHLEMQRYHPEREFMGPMQLEVELAYYGTPMTDLRDLGPLVAQDPRFLRCPAEHMGAALLRRELDFDDHQTVADWASAFASSEYRLKELIAAIVSSDEYRAGGLVEGAEEDELADRALTHRMLTAQQLASATEELTGFRWEYEGFPLMDNDEIGYRVLAGGIDGDALQLTQQDPGVTWALVVERLAQAVSSEVVTGELVEKTRSPLLFDQITLDMVPGDEGFTAQLQALHLRLLGIPLDETRQEGLEALWTAVIDQPDVGPPDAWASVLQVLLRDPDFVTY